jgi:hypothetical protein
MIFRGAATYFVFGGDDGANFTDTSIEYDIWEFLHEY